MSIKQLKSFEVCVDVTLVYLYKNVQAETADEAKHTAVALCLRDKKSADNVFQDGAPSARVTRDPNYS